MTTFCTSFNRYQTATGPTFLDALPLINHDAARTAACAAMVGAVAKATAVTRADRAMQMQWSSMAGELEEIQQYY